MEGNQIRAGESGCIQLILGKQFDGGREVFVVSIPVSFVQFGQSMKNIAEHDQTGFFAQPIMGIVVAVVMIVFVVVMFMTGGRQQVDIRGAINGYSIGLI